MSEREALIKRDKLTAAMDKLVVAVSKEWGTGSTEHNLVRDIVDLIARVPGPVAALAMPDREAIADPWQPIETAPKDGRWLLLAEQDIADVEPSLYAGAWHPDGYWMANCGQRVTSAPEPTHWTPRPAAPLALTVGGGQ